MTATIVLISIKVLPKLTKCFKKHVFLAFVNITRDLWIAIKNHNSLTLMLHQTRHLLKAPQRLSKPKASEVLTFYIQQCKEPPWTSYFVKYNSVVDDQWGKSHFNWKIGKSNYHILRTGCYPYIKYHCTKRPEQNLILEDIFFRCIKVINLGRWKAFTTDLIGIPCLAYGIAAIFLIKHTEIVSTPCGPTKIYFLYPEDKGAEY